MRKPRTRPIRGQRVLDRPEPDASDDYKPGERVLCHPPGEVIPGTVVQHNPDWEDYWVKLDRHPAAITPDLTIDNLVYPCTYRILSRPTAVDLLSDV